MTGTLLTLPDDPRFTQLVADWESGEYQRAAWSYGLYPVSRWWLKAFEVGLSEHYPFASSDDLTLTARHYFPGYLSAGHDVP